MTLTRPNPHIPSIIQLAVSGLGMLFMWGLALYYGLLSIPHLFKAGQNNDAATLFGVAVNFVVLGAIIAPSAFFSFMRLIGHPKGITSRDVPRYSFLIILVWPLSLTLGNLILKIGSWSLFVFPVAQVAAVVLLVFWFYLVARSGLDGSSAQRTWGFLSAGLIGGTAISLVLEILGGILLVLGLILFLVVKPDLLAEMQRLVNSIKSAGQDADAILKLITPYLSHPSVLITLFLTVSLAVPIIEEAAKPIGLWFLVKRGITPAEGFIGGLISGAGFALCESLIGTSRLLDSSWLLVATMRFGTTLIHMLASGLVGWGLASAWTQRKYLRLAGGYAAAVLFHGIWNGLAILFALVQIPGFQSSVSSSKSVMLTNWGLGIWTLVALGTLFFINSRLRKRSNPVIAE